MTKSIYNQLLETARNFDGYVYEREDLYERGENKAAAKLSDDIIAAACEMRCVIETILKEYDYVNSPNAAAGDPF